MDLQTKTTSLNAFQVNYNNDEEEFFHLDLLYDWEFKSSQYYDFLKNLKGCMFAAL